MPTSFETTIIGDGNHASLLIPDWVIEELNTNRRAPLRVTVNGHTYQSTAVGVGGETRVVFPSADRLAANAAAGDVVQVHLELDSGYREVSMPEALVEALAENKLTETFAELSYSKRKEFARQVTEAKTDETRTRRVQKVLESIRS